MKLFKNMTLDERVEVIGGSLAIALFRGDFKTRLWNWIEYCHRFPLPKARYKKAKP